MAQTRCDGTRPPAEAQLPAFVDVAAVADGNDKDEQHAVVNLVDDPVVTGPDTPLAVASNQLLGPARARFAGKQFDRRLDPPLGGPVQLA